MEKFLAFLVLISSAVSAACISILAYTYMTGTIPFIEFPVYQKVSDRAFKQRQEELARNRNLDTSKERIAEDYLYTFYKELSEERQKIASDKEDLAEKKRSVEEILKQANLMQEKITQAEAKVKRLLVFIDEKQQENLKRTAKMLSGMDVAASSKMVLQWDEKKAAQILYFMNDKQTGKIIAEIVQTKQKANIEKAEKIVAIMEKISEKPVGM